jgi:predicted acylesterase/phospholipase RssA
VTSRGVYAAAILGALQAMEDGNYPPACLAASGSAVLPAGLLACGVKLAVIEEIFKELANPLLWKRAPRAEAGICDPAALDNFLSGALRGLEIRAPGRLFRAVSFSLSTGLPEVHEDGNLYAPARAGIAPQGIFPPLIVDGGAILVSGEHETEALAAAARQLAPAPVTLLRTAAPALGPSPMSYRSLTGASHFRLLQSPAAIDKRLRLEAVLGAAAGKVPSGAAQRSLVIPVAENILPMDWTQWVKLRDAAYEWTAKELEMDHAPSERSNIKSG